MVGEVNGESATTTSSKCTEEIYWNDFREEGLYCMSNLPLEAGIVLIERQEICQILEKYLKSKRAW